MKTGLYTTSTRLVKTLPTFALLLIAQLSFGQFRTYNKVYSDNIKGAAVLFGNTLTHIVTDGVADTAKMNNNRANGNSTYGNDNSNIQYVDIDGSTGIGSGTRNSSSAELILPAGTNTIKLARLYWGGRVRRNEFNLAQDSSKKIKIRFGAENYTEYLAAQIDKNTTGTNTNTVNQYQAYVDITNLVKTKGAGSYTVGNAALSIGSTGSGGNYGGWCIVVVYENLSLSNYNSVRFYDGFQQVYDGGSTQISSVTLTGLNVPSGTMNFRDAKMGAMVWEGDANLKLDYLKINGIHFQNELNAIDNPWNGTITDTGSHVTTKFPNYTNQMGIDIDQYYVGTGFGIQPGDTSVQLEFGTEADQYFPGLFIFQIKTNDPTVTIDKTVKDANNNHVAQVNEELTYTLRGRNTGVGNANGVIITDSLPSTVTYKPGSMRVLSSNGVTPGTILTDACGDDLADYVANGRVIVFRTGIGANDIKGGILAPNDSFAIEFKVTVNNPGAGLSVPAIINVARIIGYSDAGAKSTDDGTAILEPMGGPLPVTLQSFLVTLLNNHQARIDFSTSMELNCAFYIIEKSIDGKNFSTVTTLAGAGNSSVKKFYTYTDDVRAVAATYQYYRLAQVDVDGKKSYSKIVSVRLNKAISDIMVSPNPFNSHLNINLESEKEETANIQVINLMGKIVAAKSIHLNKGSNYIALAELANLPTGNYYLKFSNAAGTTIKQISKQ
ncbi:MAG: hypothetical protein RLY16_1518 [Bacteroidota bacterium]